MQLWQAIIAGPSVFSTSVRSRLPGAVLRSVAGGASVGASAPVKQRGPVRPRVSPAANGYGHRWAWQQCQGGPLAALALL